MFCPNCGSLMYPHGDKLVCHKEGCGFERGMTAKDSVMSRVLTEAREPPEPLVLDEVAGALPRTRIECPKCGNFEAMWYMRQTRSADEPETRIYRCTGCSHTWREY
ncbi:MAG: transcription factor S [Thermoplasmata archaeon]|nr:transcription factor S [Candidatus Thermoplasmatota archaeon]